MTKWPKQHHNLIALLGFSLLLCGAGYFFAVKPLRQDNEKDKRDMDGTKLKLKKGGWPTDAVRLQKLLEYKKGLLVKKQDSENAYKATGLKNKSNLLLQECTNVFNRKIKKIFVNPADFSREITRLDYQDEYNTVREKLAKKDIYFSEQSLGMGNDSDQKLIYPLVLQIWLVDEILNLAADNSLQIITDKNSNVKNEKGLLKKAVSVKLLPVKPYSLYPNDEKIFVIEFPLRMTLRGTLTEFTSFLRDIHSDGKYFPVSRLQLRARPGWEKMGSKTFLNNDLLDIELECSAFFRHPENAPPKQIKEKKIPILPAGA